jgi:hypothetical protein
MPQRKVADTAASLSGPWPDPGLEARPRKQLGDQCRQAPAAEIQPGSDQPRQTSCESRPRRATCFALEHPHLAFRRRERSSKERASEAPKRHAGKEITADA